ncbi:MAG: DbpA RNA binding domain-containing protein [Bacteroidia bacterium]|nr:DbpA RNA binding domain-containing protein [Bacteroidia bacterium]
MYNTPVYPEQLIELVNTNTHSRKIPIGKIDLLKSFSFFEVEASHADDLIVALNNAKFNNKRVAVEIAQEKSDKPARNRYNDRKPAKWSYRKQEKKRKKKPYRAVSIS